MIHVNYTCNTTEIIYDDYKIILMDLYPNDKTDKLYSYVRIDAYRTPETKIIDQIEYDRLIEESRNLFKNKMKR
ncbi:gp73 [Sphingomonas phage PAU]|uniref:gp73 n=1 Tax=Sphingomonas phage PAU TaxID=1150991 RepID=UPI00025731D3|nr:gp73 [Sphingomonas phage PAU]AFF28071.1 gp73 [Sphingomonas phage PAU]